MGGVITRRGLDLGLCFGLLALLCVATASCGKGAKGDCPALDACTGSPAGAWQITNGAADSCQIPVVRPLQATSDVTEFAGHTTPLGPTLAPPQANPVVLQQTTSGDWCSALVLTPEDTVPQVNLWHEMPNLDSGTINFGGDHTYITQLIFSTTSLSRERNTTHFAPLCLLANGGGHPDPVTGMPGKGVCDLLQAGITKYYTDGRVSMAVPVNFTPVVDPKDATRPACEPASDGGCDCAYVYNVQVDDSGEWAVPPDAPTTILQDSASLTYNAAPVNSHMPATTMESTFCAAGGRLQLSGADGGSLFTLQGLRTLVLSPM